MLAGCLLASGCQREEPVAPVSPPPPAAPAVAEPTTEQRVELPAGHPPIDMASQQLPAEVLAHADTPAWEVPAGWEEGRASSIRRGSFAVSGSDGQTVDIAVTVFPGDVGGLLANINRWRNQIGLASIGPDGVDALTETITIGDREALLVNLAGDPPSTPGATPQAMTVAILMQGQNSWFFKMTGDAPLVAANKAALIAFVQSVRF